MNRRPHFTQLLRQAAALVLEFGQLEAGDEGSLVVLVPESFRGDRRYLDAAIVLNAAEPVVLAELAKKTPNLDELPDAEVLAGGGLELV
jgi:hypothetical protein